jgi:hypothetical protein
MKKPFLRISKWLGDIPVEGYCASCPDVQFKASAAGYRPSRAEYQKSLQTAFDTHLKNAHPDLSPGTIMPLRP